MTHAACPYCAVAFPACCERQFSTGPCCCTCPAAAPFRQAGKAAPRRHAALTARAARCQAAEQPAEPAAQQAELPRRSVLGGALAAAAAVAAQPALPACANRVLSPEWEVVDLPVEKGVVLLDVGFTGTDPNHGARPRGGRA